MIKRFFLLLVCSFAVYIVQGQLTPNLLCDKDTERPACVFSCPPQKTCDTRNVEFDCAAPPEGTKCTDKCICKSGYFRNVLNQCITNAECDKCKGENEFYGCSTPCDNECSKLPKQSRIKCPIKNIQCTRQCYCKDGFARDSQKKCIPVAQCRK